MPINKATFLRHIFILFLFLVTMTCGMNAKASIALSNTRVIFDSAKREASLIVNNDKQNVLIQSWIESNTEDDQGELPFAISPPLVKMQPNSQQLLRILYAGGNNSLPQDKESVFWLNVQEVPVTSEGENVLQIAVRQRIKLFFRPQNLVGVSTEAPASLQWSIDSSNGKKVLHVDNPSAYHVSINSIQLNQGNSIVEPLMIAPQEKMQFALPNTIETGAMLRFVAMNDYGGTDDYAVRLLGTQAVTASMDVLP